MSDAKHVPGYEPNPVYSQEDWDEVMDSPELTEEDFARARPLEEADPTLYASLKKTQATARHRQKVAYADPADPALTNEERETAKLSGFVRSVRAARGLSQREFADTYGMMLGRLRDWEQGRHRPDAMTVRYLATIAHEPEAVARALSKERQAA